MKSPSQPTVAPRRNDRPFYTVIAAVIAFTVFIGFAPTFYLRGMFEAKPLSTGSWGQPRQCWQS